jgi:hypothetical protein
MRACLSLAIALLLCVSLAAAVDSTTVSEASATHEVELKQIERSFAQEQAWSQFIAGHHAELLEMQVWTQCQLYCRCVS